MHPSSCNKSNNRLIRNSDKSNYVYACDQYNTIQYKLHHHWKSYYWSPHLQINCLLHQNMIASILCMVYPTNKAQIRTLRKHWQNIMLGIQSEYKVLIRSEQNLIVSHIFVYNQTIACIDMMTVPTEKKYIVGISSISNTLHSQEQKDIYHHFLFIIKLNFKCVSHIRNTSWMEDRTNTISIHSY